MISDSRVICLTYKLSELNAKTHRKRVLEEVLKDIEKV